MAGGGHGVRWVLFGLLVAVGLAAGLGAAYGQSRREPTLYRAEMSLVVERGNQPLPGGAGTSGLVSTFHRLIESNVVAANVIQNLALQESPSTFLDRLSVAKSGNSSVLRVRVDDPDAGQATKIAQQLGLVFTQLVLQRFGQQTTATAQPIQIAVFDPAHVVPGKASPRLRRDLAWGGLLGLLGGLLVANLGARRRGPKGSVKGLRLLGDLRLPGGAEQVADSLIELSARQPFQTVGVAGDPEGAATAGIAHALAERGQLTIWIRSDDADPVELERLTARCAYVLVAGARLDPGLHVDVAIAVTSEANGDTAASLAGQPGLRVLGTVAANEHGAG